MQKSKAKKSMWIILSPSFLFFILLICGCVSSTQIRILPGINLNGFGYVYISPLTYPDGSVDRYGIRTKVASMFSNEGLRVLSEDEVKNFDKNKFGQLLYCTINHFHSSLAGGLGGTYATVIIDCYDALNRNIYHGIGKFQGAFTVSDDLDGAVNRAFQGFSAKYTGFNPAVAIDINEEIKRRYADWETIDLNKGQLENYYDQNLKSLDQIEGIWSEVENKQYKIGIIREKDSTTRDFVAIIVESITPFWIPKQVKIEFEKTAYANAYSATYYMIDHSKQGTTAIITNEGLLEFNLKNPDGTSSKIYFIKNYPMNIGGEFERIVDSSPEKSIGMGSGFLISKSGLVVTNYHVVKQKNEIEVVFPEIKKILKASVALKDENNDLVVLRLSDFNFSKIYSGTIPYFISSSKSVSLGQNVFTLGYPLGEVLGKSAKFSTGAISSLYGIQDDPRVYQISNPIQPGNSGGPLFNKEGELIGIIVASINAKFLYEKADILPQNINFAIKSDYLINLISMLPDGDEVLKRPNKLAGLKLEDQVKMITPYVLQIKAK